MSLKRFFKQSWCDAYFNNMFWILGGCLSVLKASDRRLMLHVPSGAWLDSVTLEQAYVDYERL
jgi:hypothetical protein